MSMHTQNQSSGNNCYCHDFISVIREFYPRRSCFKQLGSKDFVQFVIGHGSSIWGNTSVTWGREHFCIIDWDIHWWSGPGQTTGYPGNDGHRFIPHPSRSRSTGAASLQLSSSFPSSHSPLPHLFYFFRQVPSSKKYERL